VADGTVSLLDQAGQWTHRDRHQHLHFGIEVPDRTVELRIRFRWSPHDMGSEHEANAASLYLFGPDGFRGAVRRSDDDGWTVIGESSATPGCVAGSIPGGGWVLNIDTGLILNDGAEAGHLTWHLEASARLGEPAAAGSPAHVGEARRPSAGGARWYRGDLHSHTVHSDGEITVEDRVRGAVERGLEFLAITDHNTISHHRELDGWPDEIVPIRGSEVTTFHGHINVFGLAAAIDWRDDRRGGGAAGVVEQAHRQDALASINHPSAFGDPWCVGCHWDFAQVDYSTFDAMEVWNGRWAIPETDNEGALALWTDLLDAGIRITGVSGTDSHSAEEDAYVALPSTYVHADDATEAAILEGMRRQRVFLSSGPSVTFRATSSDGVEVVLPGDELPDGALRLTVDVERLAAPATLWFVTSASAIALAQCEPGAARAVQGRELTVSRWWRLELRAGSAANGDVLALTNPVYVAAG
jgi:PHP domain